MASAQPQTTPDLFDAQSPPVTRSSRTAAPKLSWMAIVIVALGVALLLWMAWITKAVMAGGDIRPVFAAVRLQPLVEEYVQAQARTTSPEEQVTRETQAFMARLDAELKKRGAQGTTVLVAEAVLSKDVPDITAEVRRAVHADVPLPAASAATGAGNAPVR